MSLVNYISSRFAQPVEGRFLNFARAVSFLSVMLGVMALLISLAILGGFQSELQRSAVKFTSHITVNTVNKEPITNYRVLEQNLKTKFNYIKGIAPIFEREGLVKTKNHTDGVLIKSFDYNNDINNFKKNIVDGNPKFSSDSSKEVIIGKRLLRKINLALGDDLILYAVNSTDNNFPDAKIGKFKIVGVYQTGMAQYDDLLVYVPNRTASNFFKLDESSCTKFEIMIDDISTVNGYSKAIMKDLGYPYWTMTYYELHSSIFAWIELQKEPIPIVLGLISIVAVLNIITTLLITVVEKTHSIGILRTLGMSKRQIVGIFINQGLRLGLGAMLAGASLAYSFSILQQKFQLIKLKGEIYFLDSLPINISLIDYVVVLSITFVFVLLSTIVPALIAARLSPVKALRFK